MRMRGVAVGLKEEMCREASGTQMGSKRGWRAEPERQNTKRAGEQPGPHFQRDLISKPHFHGDLSEPVPFAQRRRAVRKGTGPQILGPALWTCPRRGGA